jgi:hypothetical protein
MEDIRVAVEGRGRGKSRGDVVTRGLRVLKGWLWWRELWPRVSVITTADAAAATAAS